MFQNILLGTDGSAAPERAAEVAASLSARYNAQVTVIHAFSPIANRLGEPNFEEAARKALGESRQLVESTASRLHELGVAKTDCDVMGGAAADVILTVAQTRQADLIVLGAHGLNRLQSILLGSASQGAGCGHLRQVKQVAQLPGRQQLRVEDFATVGNVHMPETLPQLSDFVQGHLHALLSAKNAHVVIHRRLHLRADVGSQLRPAIV